MSEYYFLYRPIRINNIGGILPSVNVEGLELGLGCRDNLYLGKTDDPQKVDHIKEYFIRFISQDAGKGFNLIDVERIQEIQDDGSVNERELTEEELRWKKAAYRECIKFVLRDYLEHDFGDLPDMVADMYKKIEIVEKVCMLLAKHVLDEYTLSDDEKNELLGYINKYKDKLDNGEILIRAQLEEDGVAMYNKLLNASSALNAKIRDLYLQQLQSDDSQQ